MTENIIRFFVGANTPDGFCGYHHDLCDAAAGWRAFLIKSGPGTGKSSLMKRVLQEMVAQGLAVEALHCSSDPQSLDGVVIPAIRTVIFDATAPHVLEPRYWGVVEETVDLARYMDSDRLQQHRDAIIRLTDACSEAHRQAQRYMAAAATLLKDNRRLVIPAIDREKVLATATRLAGREFLKSGQQGKETRRFLTALTPAGWVTFEETLTALCPRLYAIEDEVGEVSALLMTELRRLGTEAGLEMTACTHPLTGEVAHILFPSAGVGFATSDGLHKLGCPVTRRIHASRFTDAEIVRQHRERMKFHRKAAEALLEEAAVSVKRAKSLHDQMEGYSAAAMDWDGVEAAQKKVLAACLARIAAHNG